MAEARERHASTWARLSGQSLITIVSDVRGAVDYIHGLSTETVAFVVGSSYVAGMVRHVLSSSRQELP